MGTVVFTEEAQAVTTSARLTPFLDVLPIPPVLTGASHSLTISQTNYFFHDRWKNAPIPARGYNGGTKTGGYLGPTIVAQKGTPTTVNYANALPRKHLLNVDPTLMQMKGKPVNSRILTHLHGGFLQAPVPIPKLLIAPGEQADVVFDFTGTSGNVDLIDTPLPPTTVSPATPLAQVEIMRFKVAGPVSVPDGPLPGQLRDTAFSVPGTSARERFLTLEERLAGPVPTALVLNGMRFGEVDAQGNRIVTERPNLGEKEVWTMINVSADSHPMHLHLTQFEVLERHQLDVAGYQQALDAARAAAGGPVNANGQLVNPDPTPFLQGPADVDPNEKGPKDTVRANPAQITKIKVPFDIAGKYVWHCHILEHEENDMMRPYDVV